MGKLFSDYRRNLIARMLMDVVKLLLVAAVPTEFFSQLHIISRMIAGFMMCAIFMSAWVLCPSEKKLED